MKDMVNSNQAPGVWHDGIAIVRIIVGVMVIFHGWQVFEENEMQGSITFLGPNMKDELGRIDLLNVGFKKFSDEDAEANTEKIKRFNVELYVEKMVFTINEYDS